MTFEAMLLGFRSGMRAYAMYLTHDHTAAADLYQDTCLRVWKAKENFQPGTNFEAWVTTVMRNHWFDQIRKTRLRKENQFDEGSEQYLMQMSILPSGTAAIELEDCFTAVAESLNERQREAIILHTVEGWTIEDIAAKQGVPEGTIKSRIFRAREILAKKTGRNL